MKKTKTFWTLVLASIALLALLGVVMQYQLQQFDRAQKNQINSRIKQQAAVLQTSIDNTLTNVTRDLMRIKDDDRLLQVSASDTQAPDLLTAIEKDWLATIKAQPNYQQIRLIDAQGNETLRIERNSKNGNIASAKALQNKSNRDYFIDAKSNPSALVISQFDLNQEFGQIQYPLTPTIRLYSSLIVEGRWSGIVIINYNASEMFADLKRLSAANFKVINQEGFYLVHPDKDLEWGWLIGKPEANFITQYPNQWSAYTQGQPLPKRDNAWLIGDLSNGNSQLPQLYFVYKYDFNTGIKAQIQDNPLILIMLIALVIYICLVAWVYFTLTDLQFQTLRAEKATREAEVALNVKSRFLANMSHEIRTPLNGIMGFFQLLADSKLDDKQQGFAENGLNSTRLLSRILNDILDFSKLEAKKLEIVEKPFQIDKMLRELSSLMSNSLDGKRLDLWFDIEPNIPSYLIGDDIRIRQILINLTNNAIKFTQDGYVKVSVKTISNNAEHVTLYFSVTDTGVGIPPDKLNSIFDSFNQAHANKFGGTGLGLSICKTLLGLMNTQLDVISEEGVGSTFSFELTLQKDRRADVPIAANKLSRLHQQIHDEIVVAIISPNTIAQHMFSQYCTQFNWQYQCFETASELRDMMQNHPNSSLVVLVDNGEIKKEFLAELYEQQKAFEGVSLIFLFLTFHSDLDSTLDPHHMSIIDGQFIKPITASTLFDAVVDGLYSHSISNEKKLATNSDNSTFANAKVLLVEDNLINQEVAANLLQGFKVNPIIASNGQEAVEILSQRPDYFDLVFMDIQMPILDGIEATKIIRQASTLNHIPIVAMTANALPEDKIRCIDAGMNDHLAKPFNKLHLLDMLKRYLKNSM